MADCEPNGVNGDAPKKRMRRGGFFGRLPVDQRQALEEMVGNALLSRSELFRQLLDPRRSIDQECGYPDSETQGGFGALNPDFYRTLYAREAVATRVVQCLPKESWQVTPFVYEDEDPSTDTPFEQAWDELGASLGGVPSHYRQEEGSPIWDYLKRADVLSGIGHFGILLIGIDDGKHLDEPADGVAEVAANEEWSLNQWLSMRSEPAARPFIVNAKGPAAAKLREDTNAQEKAFQAGDKTRRQQREQQLRGAAQKAGIHPDAPGSASQTMRLIDGDRGQGDPSRGRSPGDLRWGQAGAESQYERQSDGTSLLQPSSQMYRVTPEAPNVKLQSSPYGADAQGSEMKSPWGSSPTKSPWSQEPGEVPPGAWAPPTGLMGTDAQYVGVQLSPSEYPASQPSPQRRKLLFLRAYDESLVQIVQYEANVLNPRFGQPVMYRVTLNDPREMHSGVGLPMATVRVHWSRVIHLADNRDSSEIFGVPRMRPVLNRLLDLRKLYSGSAEMYWRGAFPGISIETQPQLGGDVQIDVDETRDFMEQYMNGLQRYLMLMGMSAKTLSPTVVDPSAQIQVQIEAICIQLAIPKRVFMGSERGELASAQDDDAWNDRLKERQQGYITPRIIVPFIDRMIAMGVLPPPRPVKEVPVGAGASGGRGGVGGGMRGDREHGPHSDLPFIGEDGEFGAPEDELEGTDAEEGGMGEGRDGDESYLDDKEGYKANPFQRGGPSAPPPSQPRRGNPFLQKGEGEEGGGRKGKKAEWFSQNAVGTSVMRVKGGYCIEWPDITSLSEAQRVQIALQKTQAMGAYIQGQVETLCPPLDWFTRVLEVDEEEARAVLESALRVHEREEQKAEADDPFGGAGPGGMGPGGPGAGGDGMGPLFPPEGGGGMDGNFGYDEGGQEKGEEAPPFEEGEEEPPMSPLLPRKSSSPLLQRQPTVNMNDEHDPVSGRFAPKGGGGGGEEDPEREAAVRSAWKETLEAMREGTAGAHLKAGKAHDAVLVRHGDPKGLHRRAMQYHYDRMDAIEPYQDQAGKATHGRILDDLRDAGLEPQASTVLGIRSKEMMSVLWFSSKDRARTVAERYGAKVNSPQKGISVVRTGRIMKQAYPVKIKHTPVIPAMNRRGPIFNAPFGGPPKLPGMKPPSMKPPQPPFAAKPGQPPDVGGQGPGGFAGGEEQGPPGAGAPPIPGGMPPGMGGPPQEDPADKRRKQIAQAIEVSLEGKHGSVEDEEGEEMPEAKGMLEDGEALPEEDGGEGEGDRSPGALFADEDGIHQEEEGGQEASQTPPPAGPAPEPSGGGPLPPRKPSPSPLLQRPDTRPVPKEVNHPPAREPMQAGMPNPKRTPALSGEPEPGHSAPAQSPFPPKRGAASVPDQEQLKAATRKVHNLLSNVSPEVAAVLVNHLRRHDFDEECVVNLAAAAERGGDALANLLTNMNEHHNPETGRFAEGGGGEGEHKRFRPGEVAPPPLSRVVKAVAGLEEGQVKTYHGVSMWMTLEKETAGIFRTPRKRSEPVKTWWVQAGGGAQFSKTPEAAAEKALRLMRHIHRNPDEYEDHDMGERLTGKIPKKGK